MELNLDPAMLVRPDFFSRFTGHDRGLWALNDWLWRDARGTVRVFAGDGGEGATIDVTRRSARDGEVIIRLKLIGR